MVFIYLYIMNDKKDIRSIADIQLLVNNFYAAIRSNEALGPIFNERISDRWPEHLEKMYRFWQTVLLEDHTYFGSPFPHMHNCRWISNTSTPGCNYGTKRLIFISEAPKQTKQSGAEIRWRLCFCLRSPTIETTALGRSCDLFQ
ncbi:group III truncated hemoglobin [Niabella sp. W65]|nr:group III truncated hemoglobin [Niabella sp. W65]MCH7367850.1 group III truncated hemoglobin [Niabella sp. W65]